MKKLISAVMLAGAMVAMAKTSTPEGWTDDYDAALKRAAEENKNIVADFSGSDWCGWCKKLDREVFNTDVFRKGAVDKFVLLMIDSPNDQSLLSEKAAKQNPGLVKKYGIRGFPTVLILDASGKQVGKLGYQRGGPENYLKLLEPYVKEAPDVEKFLKPIKDLLSAPEKEAEKDVAAIEAEIKAKFPEPNGPLSDAEKKQRGEDMMDAYKAAYYNKICAKYIPMFDKAFADARAVKVPAELEAKKTELINSKEKAFKWMKSEYEAYLKAKKSKSK